MPLHDWLSLLTICLLGAMFPGASLALVLRYTLHSRAHGIAAALGHASGMGLYALLAVLGLVLVLQQSALLHTAISYAGAGYLLWLGYQGLRARPAPSTAIQAATPSSLYAAARAGFFMALLNPKVGLFFLALFSQFVQAAMGWDARAIFIATIALVDGGWYALVASVLAHGSVLAWLRQHQVWVERALGVVLIGFALKILSGLPDTL